MTPRSSSAPSRRSFLSSTAVAAAVVAGGAPLLSACSSAPGSSSKGGGTTSGKDAKKILPAFVAQNVVTPDIPSKNGSSAGFTRPLKTADLETSVPTPLGRGSTVKVMAPFWGSPPKARNPYYDAMNKLIGADLVWHNQDGNTYDQKLGAVLASSEIPDMVVIPSWNLGGRIPSAVISKFADLGPYLSGDRIKEYPNLAAIPTESWQRSLFGGRLRGIPMPSSYVANIVPFYRKDVFDQEGYELPTSADEFLALAKDITNARAKRWACDDMKWTAFNIFGVLSGSEKPLGWNLVDGELVYRVETDAYLEALEWTRKLYAAGYVHPDARAGRTQGDPGLRFTSGETLIYNQDISHWYGKTAEQATRRTGVVIWGMDLFGHDGGDPTLWAGSPANIWSFISAKASDAVVRDALAAANVTAAPYGTKEYMLTQYGVEGVHYTVEDGLPVKNDRGNTEVVNAYVMLDGPPPTLAHPDLPDITTAQVAWQQRMGAFTEKSSFYGLQITEPARYTNLSNDFEQLEDDVVRGRKKISDMQQAVSDWKSKGGDQLRDWYRKLLDDSSPQG
ncbi:extracellular solute-binding protein [Streptomyces sp. NPDC088554]|uniref:extracellular solute-binding protein n=2 Tax=unclassified Streptomyces TaxID=2593676 RepID=UPI0037F74E2B